MSAERVPPHDAALEAALLGAVLLLPQHFAAAARTVDAGDFYLPAHGALWAAAVKLHDDGHRPDAVTLRDECATAGQPVPAQVISACLENPAGSWKRAAEGVVRLAAARRTLGVLAACTEALWAGQDAYEVLADAQAQLASVDVPVGAVPDDLSTIEAFMAESKETQAPWVIPGLLRRGWRAVIVAEEGIGKSLLAQQVALCAAAGIHPLAHTPMEPVVSLMVDLENDPERIRYGVDLIDQRLDGVRRVEGGAWLWRRPAGIDLRQRRDRSAFEAVLAHCRPQLVCLGPIYKAYNSKASESDERVAAEVQTVFDDLRTRFGFALMLEHHAPHGDHGSRQLRPYGSSLWLRWPEFGIGMKESSEVKKAYELLRWRGDRVVAAWPDRIDRGKTGAFPWVGFWKNGIPA